MDIDHGPIKLKPTVSRATAASIAAALLLVGRCCAAPAPPAGAGTRWSASGSDLRPVVYDAGLVDSVDTASVEHDFVLRNNSAAQVTITSLAPSCRCTSADVARAAAGPARYRAISGPIAVGPGQSERVRVTVDLAERAAGPFSESVYVDEAGKSSPSAIFEIDADVVPGMQASPQALDFGSVAPNSARSETVAILYDRSLGSAPPILTCADPRIGIGIASIKPAGHGAFASAEYVITVKSDATGPLVAVISAKSNARPVPPLSIPLTALIAAGPR